MGIRDKPIAPASPWQNSFAERLIGSIRRECLDHIICPGRGTSASDSEKLCGLLQRRENASVIEQRCACLSPGSAIRRHKFARHTGRTSSSIRSDLDFRYTQLNADFVLGLTGTPIENRLEDLWCIMDRVAPGYLGDLKIFSATHTEDAHDALKDLKAKLDESRLGLPAIMLRR